MSTSTTTAAPAMVDVRGPRFAAWVTTVVIVATLIAAAFSSIAAAVILGVQAVVFAIGARRGPASASLRPGLPAPRRSPSRTRHREGTRAAAEVRPVGRVRVRGGRRRRIRRRHSAARPGRHRLRALRGVPQRGLRHLPGLPDLSARRTVSPLRRPPHNAQTASNRKEFVHGTLRRPGLHRLGREQSRRAEHCLRRGRRGHLAPTTAATSRAQSSWTGRPTCRTRSSATSSTPSSSRSCCPSAASPTTTP